MVSENLQFFSLIFPFSSLRLSLLKAGRPQSMRRKAQKALETTWGAAQEETLLGLGGFQHSGI